MGEFLKNPLAEVRRVEGMCGQYKKRHEKGYLNTVGRLLLSIKWDGPHETPLAR